MARPSVVVTGSTRGIGLGLAKHFALRGCNVVVSGRSQQNCDAAAEAVRSTAAVGVEVMGIACDITDPRQSEALWAKASAAFKRIDIWINNAGAINRMTVVSSLDADDILAVPRINLTGTVYACRTALNGMNAQDSIDGIKGAIYNFEGFGSDGTQTAGLSIYGATKFGLTYFTKSLIRETKGGQVLVGFMSPGLVTTEMLLRAAQEMPPERWARTKKIYRILANDADTVSAWLVDRVLANRRHGAHIAWLTRIKAAGRFFKSLAFKPKPLPDLEAA